MKPQAVGRRVETALIGKGIDGHAYPGMPVCKESLTEMPITRNLSQMPSFRRAWNRIAKTVPPLVLVVDDDAMRSLGRRRYPRGRGLRGSRGLRRRRGLADPRGPSRYQRRLLGCGDARRPRRPGARVSCERALSRHRHRPDLGRTCDRPDEPSARRALREKALCRGGLAPTHRRRDGKARSRSGRTARLVGVKGVAASSRRPRDHEIFRESDAGSFRRNCDNAMCWRAIRRSDGVLAGVVRAWLRPAASARKVMPRARRSGPGRPAGSR